MAPFSHYIPPFTTQGLRGRQQAACGTFVETIQHSTGPSCPVCAIFLERGAPPLTAVTVRERHYLAVSNVTMESDGLYAEATADCFEPGILTITSVRDDVVLKVYQSHQWASAIVRGRDGEIDFMLENNHVHELQRVG